MTDEIIVMRQPPKLSTLLQWRTILKHKNQWDDKLGKWNRKNPKERLKPIGREIQSIEALEPLCLGNTWPARYVLIMQTILNIPLSVCICIFDVVDWFALQGIEEDMAPPTDPQQSQKKHYGNTTLGTSTDNGLRTEGKGEWST